MVIFHSYRNSLLGMMPLKKHIHERKRSKSSFRGDSSPPQARGRSWPWGQRGLPCICPGIRRDTSIRPTRGAGAEWRMSWRQDTCGYQTLRIIYIESVTFFCVVNRINNLVCKNRKEITSVPELPWCMASGGCSVRSPFKDGLQTTKLVDGLMCCHILHSETSFTELVTQLSMVCV